MDVSSINSNVITPPIAAQPTNSGNDNSANVNVNINANDASATESPASIYEKSNGENSAYPIDRAEVQKLLDETNQQREALIQMIQKMIYRQGNTESVAFTDRKSTRLNSSH